MHLSLFTTFSPNILVCPPNIFGKSTPLEIRISFAAIDAILSVESLQNVLIEFYLPDWNSLDKSYPYFRCMSGTYATPAGTVRVDFESGNEHRIAIDAPSYIIDTAVKVIKLDRSAVGFV